MAKTNRKRSKDQKGEKKEGNPEQVFFRGGRDLRKSSKSKGYDLFLKEKGPKEIRKLLRYKVTANTVKTWVSEWKRGENIPLSHRIQIKS